MANSCWKQEKKECQMKKKVLMSTRSLPQRPADTAEVEEGLEPSGEDPRPAPDLCELVRSGIALRHKCLDLEVVLDKKKLL